MAGEKHRLEVEEVGPASFLSVGDKFMFHGGSDGREHTITQDLDSHFEYDGRPNRRLSKDTPVKRVGAPDPGERTERVVQALTNAVRGLEATGDQSEWANAMADVIQRAATYGMDDVILPLEKLQKQGAAVFARARVFQGKSAADDLNVAIRKRWAADVNAVAQKLRDSILESRNTLREVIREVIQKCGDDYCLYTKHKKAGKRRRLGKHSSRAGAERQERAIKAHGG